MWFSERTQYRRLSIDHGRKLQKSIISGKKYGALLTDLFKASDFLPHDLIAAKVRQYVISPESLKLINSY